MNTGNPASTISTPNAQRPHPSTTCRRSYPKQITAALLTAILIAVVAAAFLYASPTAEAQEATTLIANTGQSAETVGTSLTSGFPKNAQAFTTGESQTRYTLDSIDIHFQIIGSTGTAGSQLKVTVTKEASGSPSDEICTLVDPKTFTGPGIQTFTAPLGTPCPILQPNTTYFVVIDRVSISSATISLSATTSDNEDTGGATGWTIANMARTSNGSTWNDEHSSRSRIIEIKGNVYVPPKRITSFDLHSDNDEPRGVWGNDDTFWVANDGFISNNKIYAYHRTDGSRNAANDFDTLDAAGNTRPGGLCSDGTTMFVVDEEDNKVYAYQMSDTTRDSAKDITLDSSNGNAFGISCSSTHVWVTQDADDVNSKIFAYQRSDGAHVATMDFTAATMSSSTTDGAVNNSDPRGLWSNGTTLFAIDDEDHKVYAYKMSDRSRDSDKDLPLGSTNTDPEGLWFDGRILWVADEAYDRLYAYLLPGAQPDNTLATGAPAVRTPTTDQVWTATLTVGTQTGALGYSSNTMPTVGSLSDTGFERLGTTQTIRDLYVTTEGELILTMSFEVPENFTLTVGGETFFSPGRGIDSPPFGYLYAWPDSGLSWSASDTITVSISIDPDPKIGDILTADPTGIIDATDGVENATFQYQWLHVVGSDETLIEGANRRHYSVTTADVHKSLKVRAVFDDDAGYQEPPLFSKQVGPVPTIVPDPPTALSAEPAPDATPQLAVNLSWTASRSEGASAIASHQYRYNSNEGSFGSWTTITDSGANGANATSFTVNGLSAVNNAFTKFTFEVRAVNANGNSDESNQATALINFPQQITVEAIPSDRKIELNWATPDNNGSAILGYQYAVTNLFTNTDVVSVNTDIPGSNADTTTFTVTGLTNGVPYNVRIRAVNSVGGGAYALSQGIAPATFPTEPRDLTAEAGDSQVTLRWTAPTSNGGNTIDGYEYQQQTGNAAYGSWTDISGADHNTTDHTLTGLINGTTYSFKVRAKNPKGEGPASNEVTTIPKAVPSTPQSFTATAGNGSVQLDWTTPSSDGGLPINRYEYRYKPASGSFTTWATVPGSNVNTTTYTITALTNGTSYTFEVRAATASTLGVAASDTATPMADPPGKPSVTVSDRPASLHVSWSVDNDGGSQITEYQVQWKSGSQNFDTSRQQTGLTSTNTLIENLTNFTPYMVRVRAKNVIGWSDWSDPVSGTPSPRPPPSVTITASVNEPVTAPFRVTITFIDVDSNGNEHGVTGFESDEIIAWYTRKGYDSYEFYISDFREETPGLVYSALVDEIIDGKLWIEVEADSAQSSHDGQGNTAAYETWQVDAPDPPPAPEGAQVWEDTLTIGGKEGDWDAGVMGYFIGWSPNTNKDKRFGALPNANFTYAGVDYEVLELSYIPSWRVVRLAMCPLLDGANRRFELRLDDDYVSFDPDDYQKRDFGRTKDGSRQQCREYDWGKITLDWTYGHTKNVRITR